MMKIGLVCLLAASLTTGSTFAAPPDPGASKPGDHAGRASDMPVEGVIQNPDWISRPSSDDMSNLYPTLPDALGIGGKVALVCLVSDIGILGDCRAVNEHPAGLGFGKAALSMAPLFHMRPMMVDGVPVGGAQITIPVNFPARSYSEAPAANTGSPSPRALELGRRLAIAIDGSLPTRGLEAWQAALDDKMRDDPPADDAEAKTRQTAIDDYKAAYAASSDKIIQADAGVLAASFSENTLSQITEFAESAAGREWFSGQTALIKADGIERTNLLQSIREAAAARFCAHADCPR